MPRMAVLLIPAVCYPTHVLAHAIAPCVPRRIGKGATLYLPVKVYGGLLQMGDCHTAQGDSEYDGTAIETSLTGNFKITLIKKAE